MSNKEFKWIDGYASHEFKIDKAYIAKNDIMPSKHTYRLRNRHIDFTKLDVNKLKEVYPNADFVLSTTFIENDKKERTFDEYPEINIYDDLTLAIFDNTEFYIVDDDAITVFYKDGDCKEFIKRLIDLLPIEPDKAEEAEIRTVAYDQGYYTITTKISKFDIDLEKNYNDDFLEVDSDIKKFLKDRNSGLIVLRGIMGSGKSSYIKNLLTKVPQKYIIVTNAMAERMADPEFMSFMMDHKDSVFILEDCERILMSREDINSAFGSAITNLLNMSDGLLSEVFNVKFICTFNADISKIDSALLRKGRCFANYEFKELCVEKTKALLNERNIFLDEYKPMTLAEIYNYEDTDCSNKSEKKIGF